MAAIPVINEETVTKALTVVRAGLVYGMGNPVPGEMCVEAALCYAFGLPHGDDPGCVDPALRALKIALNDSNWSSKESRAKGMERLALAQIGSLGTLGTNEFMKRVAEMTIRKIVPRALRFAASVCSEDANKKSLIAAAVRCEEEGAKSAAEAAAAAAWAAARAAAAWAEAEAWAAEAWAAEAARAAEARAAAWAAAAVRAARAAASDETLSFFAEEVVQILIEMKAPGCQWLYLTEKSA